MTTALSGSWLTPPTPILATSLSGDERDLIDKLGRDYTGEDAYPWHNDADRRVTFHIEPERIVTSG